MTSKTGECLPVLTPAHDIISECCLIDGVPCTIITGLSNIGSVLWKKNLKTGEVLPADFVCESCEAAEPTEPEPGSSCDVPLFVSSCDDEFHFVKTGYLCIDGTWQCRVLSWVNGEAQPDVVIDSGIPCDEPMPTQDPELKWIEKCVDGQLVVQLCQVVFENDGEGNITAGDPVEIGDPIDTGVPCGKQTVEVPTCDGTEEAEVDQVVALKGVVTTKPCPADVVTNDYEYVCNTDTGFYDLIQIVTTNGTAGEPIVTATTISCDEDEPDFEPVRICNADGFIHIVTTQYDEDGTATVLSDIATTEECACEKTPVDYKKKEYYFGVENRATRPNRSYTIQFTLNNGEVRDVMVPAMAAANDWGGQMAAWEVAMAAAFPEACEVANHWWEWRPNLLPNTGNGAIPPSDMVFDAAVGQFIQFTFCPDAIDYMPVDVQFTMLNGNPWSRAAVIESDESKVEYITHCLSCDPECQEDAPKCAIPVAADFPELPEPVCSNIGTEQVCVATYETDADEVTSTILVETGVFISFTSCAGVVSSYAFTIVDGNAQEHDLGPNDFYANCETLEPIEEPAPECPEGAVFNPVKVAGHYTIWDNSTYELAAGGTLNHLQNGNNYEFTFTMDDGSTVVAQQTADPYFANMFSVASAALGCKIVSVCANHTAAAGCNAGAVANLAMYPAYDAPTAPGDPQNNVSNPTRDELWATGWLIDCDCGPKPVRVTVTAANNAAHVGAFKDLITHDKAPTLIYQAVTCEGNFYKDCDGNDIAAPSCCPEPWTPDAVSCGTPTGKVLCYGTDGGGGSSYTNGDNTTDISYSNNATTIKWSVDAGLADGSGEYTLAIADCINSGEIAYLTITDSAGVTTMFAADAILAQGNANGSGGWAFTGVGGASFSGKIVSSSFTCGTESESGKAQQFYDCVSGTYTWLDCLDPSKVIDPETLTDCPVETVPVLDSVEVIQCATEAGDGYAVGDYILFIGQTTDGVLTSSTAYNLSQGNVLLDPAPATEPCDPEPKITDLQNCFLDANGVQWSSILVFLENPDENLPPIVDEILYYDLSGAIGTPAGDPKEWKPCANDSGLVDIEKVCFEYFGDEVKGYAFAYQDGEVQMGTTIDPASAVSVSNAAIYCCDDCIQVFGCRDGRLAFPAGAEVVMANGETVDIAGLNYSGAAQAVVDAYGGSFFAPSLGGPQGPNFSQCQGSSQHEIQFTNVPVKITSITQMDSYGTFGTCDFSSGCCDCPDCPEILEGSMVNSDTNSALSLPLTAQGEFINWVKPLMISSDGIDCLSDPSARFSVKITMDHGAGVFPGHRAFILSASGGSFTAQSGSNAGTLGSAFIQVGAGATDPATNARNFRWVKLTATVAEWNAGISLSGLAFGAANATSFDSLYSIEFEICPDIEELCNGC